MRVLFPAHPAQPFQGSLRVTVCGTVGRSAQHTGGGACKYTLSTVAFCVRRVCAALPMPSLAGEAVAFPREFHLPSRSPWEALHANAHHDSRGLKTALVKLAHGP